VIVNAYGTNHPKPAERNALLVPNRPAQRQRAMARNVILLAIVVTISNVLAVAFQTTLKTAGGVETTAEHRNATATVAASIALEIVTVRVVALNTAYRINARRAILMVRIHVHYVKNARFKVLA
jgi:hypothetical protein